MATTLFNNLNEADKNTAITRLIEESTPRDDFFFMTVLAVVTATFGLLLDNGAIIIGSMLIAPLLSPILSLSLGIVMADGRLLARSAGTMGKALAFAIAAAAVVTWLFGPLSGLTSEFNAEILSRTNPSIIYVFVAFAAGLAASFALIKPKMSAMLPGVMIAVALVPPLAVTGISLAHLNWGMATGSFIFFAINMVSIQFASMIVFSLMNLYVKRGIAEKVVEKEDKKLEQEKEQAQEAAQASE